jgi:hypothetical protein
MAYHGIPLIVAAVGGSVLIGVIVARRDQARARAAELARA